MSSGAHIWIPVARGRARQRRRAVVFPSNVGCGCAHDPDCKPSQFPDFILVTCEHEKTLWYFIKANHPAHPGVIKRYLYEKDGAWYAKEDGHSFASDAAQPAFKAWLAQIADLDRQAQEWIKKQHDQNPAGNSN